MHHRLYGLYPYVLCNGLWNWEMMTPPKDNDRAQKNLEMGHVTLTTPVKG